MDYVPETFAHAPIGEIVESVCSPALDPAFVGVVIAAPSAIVLSGASEAVVPLCGAFQLPVTQVINAEPMVIHARRQSDGHVISGALGISEDQLNEPEEPEPYDAGEPSAAALANTLSMGWFHLNAQDWLDIDLMNDTFTFFVTYAGTDSAEVSVNIRP